MCECAWRRCDGDGDCTAGLRCRDGACRRDQSEVHAPIKLADVSARVGRRAAQAAADARAHCELLGREVLTPADAARGVHEVQRLTFGVPDGGRVVGPTAHIKARAPDAPGQRMRVRAYSVLLGDCGGGAEGCPTFNLTVKIYPGGPPKTRGTSAHLGVLAVGATLHVPETRALRWAVAPAEAVSVGMVAFGVGIAECLEPAEMILAASGVARVTLVYANRHASQILYHDRLRALLADHPRRLALRHAISRDDVPTAADGTPTAAGVERRTRGRVDAAVIAAEFGSWAANEAHFLVVGTGAMERDAWSWIAESIGGAPRHLLQGARWRPLVQTP